MFTFLRYASRPVFFLALIALSASIALGQPARMTTDATMDAGLGGVNNIDGSVTVLNGRLDRRIRVRLSTMTQGDRTSMTDEYGKFYFRGLVSGDYTITIDGEPEFEPFSATVKIIQLRGSPPVSQMLPVRLTPKRHAVESSADVVSAEMTDVPPQAVALYNKALELSKEKDHNGAIVQLQAAIKEYGNFVLGYNELGYQYMRLSDYPKAEEAFQAALRIKSDAILPLTNHGIVLICLKKFPEAEVELQKAIKIDEQSAVAHYWLAYAIINQYSPDKKNRFNEGEKVFLMAIKLGGPQVAEAHRYLAIIYASKGDKKRQITELEAYLLLAPTAPDADQLRKTIAQLKK